MGFGADAPPASSQEPGRLRLGPGAAAAGADELLRNYVGRGGGFTPAGDDGPRIAAAALEEICAAAGVVPPHTVEVVSGRRGSHAAARGRRIYVQHRDIGAPWMRGTLAHELAHVLDWADRARRLRVGAAIAALSLIGLAALIILLQGNEVVGFPAIVALVAFAFLWGMAVLRVGEYRADAIAARLLGPQDVAALFALFEDIAANRNPPATWWAPHPSPRDRAAAVRLLLGED